MNTKKMGFLLIVLLGFLSGGVFMEVRDVFAAKCATSDDCIASCVPPKTCCSVDTAKGASVCGLEDAGGLLGWTCSDTDLAGFVSGHLCTVCESAGSHSVCLIDSQNRNCGACNQGSYRFCSEEKCVAYYSGAVIPGGDPSLDGQKDCHVSTNCTDSADCSWTSGKWDYDDDDNDGQCVKCDANNKEVSIHGDASGIYFGGNPGNNKFESACGADSACDEVVNTGDGCTIGQACENGGNPNCSGIDACDINGHCCIAPDVVDAVTGICTTAAVCDCDAAPGNDGICCGSGCVTTHNGDPDCTCAELGGTDCGVGTCDAAVGSVEIVNHSAMGFEMCCTGACVGCSPTCFTGHCLLSLANATVVAGAICCNGGQCYECNSGFVWDSVLGICMPLGGGIPDMGHSTDHGNYFKYDKEIKLVFTEGAQFLLKIAGGLALFILVVGGLFYMVSGSSPDGQTKAKKIVTYAVIGLAIVLVPFIIIDQASQIFTKVTIPIPTCYWDCGNWSACAAGTQTRVCTETCGAVVGGPAVSRACVALPASFDWRNNGGDWMTSVKDQGGCGACWAFATTGYIEAMYNIQESDLSKDINLAEQDLVSCSPGNCSGGNPGVAMQYIKAIGIVDQLCFPYVAFNQACTVKCGDPVSKIGTWFVSSAINQASIKEDLVNNGPVLTVMNIDTYNFGTMLCTSSNEGHAVVIVGYDDLGGYWIVKNSWGSGWETDGGYFKVKYGQCGIDTGTTFSVENITHP